MAPLQESLALTQGYYTYLQLVLYTDHLLKQGNISLPPHELIHKTGSHTGIALDTHRIASLISQIQAQPTAKNVYGHLGYISALKGVFGSFLDIYARSLTRRNHIKKILGGQTEGYIIAMRVCRNLLTHQHTGHVHLRKYDQERLEEELQKTGKRIVSCSFHYAELFGKTWTGWASYGFSMTINTTTFHTKRTVRDIVDEHTMYMLAESVNYICERYGKTTVKQQPIEKTVTATEKQQAETNKVKQPISRKSPILPQQPAQTKRRYRPRPRSKKTPPVAS